MTKVLSFDVSTKCTGFAFLDENDNVSFGMIPMGKNVSLKCTMSVLREAATWLCYTYLPDVVCVENTHLGVAGISVLKSLEACKYAVKEAVFVSLSLWPLEIWPQSCRAKFGIKTKQEAFDFVKDKFGYKFMKFKKHNDITDAILMALFTKEMKLKCTGECGELGEKAALVGTLFGKKCIFINNGYTTGYDSEDVIMIKYKGIGSLVETPLVYREDGKCCFYFQDIKCENTWLNLSSLYYIFLDSLLFKNESFYFTINEKFKNDFDDIFSHADWSAGMKKLKNRYKIPKDVFNKTILPALRKSVGRSKAKFLMDRVLNEENKR